jgi:hypothetical protein
VARHAKESPVDKLKADVYSFAVLVVALFATSRGLPLSNGD